MAADDSRAALRDLRREPAASAPSLIATVKLDGTCRSSEDAFWCLRGAISPLFDIAVRNRAELARFRIGLIAHRYADVLLARADMGPLLLRRSPTAIARSFGANHVMVLSLRNAVAARDGSWTAHPGDIAILDLSQPHHIALDAFAGDLLIVPRLLLAPLLGESEIPAKARLCRSVKLAAMMTRHLDALLDDAAGMTVDEASVLTPATLSLVAGCLSLATDSALATPPLHRCYAPTLLAIRRYIDGNLGASELSPRSIQLRFSVSRPQLYRLFEPLGGVAAYIRRRRLTRCFEEISASSGPRRSISEIAFAHGFLSDSAFSRTYTAHFGISPQRTREAALSTRTERRELLPSPLDQFRQWLMDL